MRALGKLLMFVGAGLGFFVGASWLLHFNPMDLPFLWAVGAVKLALVSSVFIMGAGAALIRIDNRRQGRIGAGRGSPERPH